MANEYFQPGSTPAPNSPGASAPMRGQFSNISEAFDKLPVMAGHSNEVVIVSASGNSLMSSGLMLSGLAKQTGTSKSLVLPSGTSVERDTYPEPGYLRFNEDTATLEFYNAAMWGPVTGEQGIQGPQGPQGLQGVAGVNGATGAQGPQGQKGDTGTITSIVGFFENHTPSELPLDGLIPANWDAPGVPPADLQVLIGQSLQYRGVSGADYQIDDIFVYTGGAYTNLGGARGPKGETGDQGLQGVAGTSGVQGPIGQTGAEGPLGPQGAPGAAGPQGASGVQGITGKTGPAGPTGATGAIGPRGIQGVQGPVGQSGATTVIVGTFSVRSPDELPTNGTIPPNWDSAGNPSTTLQVGVGQAMHYAGAPGAGYDTDDIFVFLGTSWVNIGNARGPAGEQGLTGAQGPTGFTGATGPIGPVGPQGSVGPQGATGPQGTQGNTGAQGPIGPQGETGPQGPTGVQGAQGAHGAKGDTGDAGTATILMGSFGLITVPADLPTTGLIPANFDGPGLPADDLQLKIGESMHYTGASGAGYATGDVFVYVSTASQVSGWINIGAVHGIKGDTGDAGADGIQGPAGANGAAGPTGPQGPVGPAGATGPQGAKGDVGMVWRGAWSAVPIYVANDAVEFEGTTWIAVQTTVGVPPPSSGGAFAIVAEGGAKGDTGAQGPTGATGPQGVPGPQGPAGASAASGVSFSPSGTISSNTVQGAIQELDAETQTALLGKVSKIGDTMSGELLNTAGVRVGSGAGAGDSSTGCYMKTDGGLELYGGGGYIDFKRANINYDWRIQGSNAANGDLVFTSSGSAVATLDDMGAGMAILKMSGGYMCKRGWGSSAQTSNIFNMYWTGSVMELYTDGTNIGNISVTSDARVKKEIQPITSTFSSSVENNFMLLEPITYKFADVGVFKDDGRTRYGFVAQDVNTLFPSVVNGDASDPESTLSLDPMQMITILTIALQDALRRIEALEAA